MEFKLYFHASFKGGVRLGTTVELKTETTLADTSRIRFLSKSKIPTLILLELQTFEQFATEAILEVIAMNCFIILFVFIPMSDKSNRDIPIPKVVFSSITIP